MSRVWISKGHINAGLANRYWEDLGRWLDQVSEPRYAEQCQEASKQGPCNGERVFAERCGFYQTYLSRIETGQANPSLNAIEVISNSLGITVFDLFEHIKTYSHKR